MLHDDTHKCLADSFETRPGMSWKWYMEVTIPRERQEDIEGLRRISSCCVAVALTTLCGIITCAHSLTASAMAMEAIITICDIAVTIARIGYGSAVLRVAVRYQSRPLKTVEGLKGWIKRRQARIFGFAILN